MRGSLRRTLDPQRYPRISNHNLLGIKTGSVEQTKIRGGSPKDRRPDGQDLLLLGEYCIESIQVDGGETHRDRVSIDMGSLG